VSYGGKEGILSELLCVVLCTTVVHNGVHTNEQFLNLRSVIGLDYKISFCVFLKV